MGCFQCRQFYDLDWTYQLHLRLYNLHFHVFCILPHVRVRWCSVQRSGRSLQRSGTCCHAGAVYRDVPGWMVCRIHVEPDAGHSHDPHPEAALHSEPRLCSCDLAHHDWNHGSNHYSLYSLWNDVGICRSACNILCLSDSLHPAVYGAGNQLEKSLCPSLWRTALRRCNDELEGNLDDSFRNHRMAGS